MNIVKIAAFSDGEVGGNPAGVVLSGSLPEVAEMQRIAAEVGFSETAFATMQDGDESWRVRYFSPESEVPFCGHATIALGAALAKEYGEGTYHLNLNEAEISVYGTEQKGQYLAALQSPPTRSSVLHSEEVDATLGLFEFARDQLSDAIIPAHIHAGADHYVIPLRTRQDLSAMNYDMDLGREFMRSRGLITIMLVVSEGNELFHVRNAFASGGVMEDPATGAAAAAFAGYLRDSGWSTTNRIALIQGEDMGMRSVITTEFTNELGSSIRVSGTTRNLG